MNLLPLFFARGKAHIRSKGRTRPAHHTFSPTLERCEKRIALAASFTSTPIVVQGSHEVSTFTNTGTVPITVGFAIYSVPDINHSFAATQTLFDSATKVLQPGQSVTLKVKIPPCPDGNQGDTFGSQGDTFGSQGDTFGSQGDTFANGGVIPSTNYPDYSAPGYLHGGQHLTLACQDKGHKGGGDDGGD